MRSFVEDEYTAALGWIHSTLRFGSRLSLERIGRLLDMLGNPEKDCRYLHVAGTNGKGSVSAMIASSLQYSGYKTGLYTSPYLEDFRERIVVNGKWIQKQSVVSLSNMIRPEVETMVRQGFEHPTEFEIVTAMAFCHYSASGCDYVALETGLGGRFDATNIVAPIVSAITTISLDHTDRLGDTLAEIAFEKAGILKAGVPAVTGVTQDESLNVIRERAKSLDCPLYVVAQKPWADVTWEETSSSIDGQEIDLRGPGFRYNNLRIPLLGKHQQQNAAIAVACLELSRPGARQKSMHLDPAAVSYGISQTKWPGRLEVIARNPLVILDGAHNPEGAIALVDSLARIPKKRLICVVGILGDKSHKETVSEIAPICDEVIVTRPDTPRALEPSHLAAEVAAFTSAVVVEPDIEKATDYALEKAECDDAVLICGSLYLVGPVRTYLQSRFGINGRRLE